MRYQFDKQYYSKQKNIRYEIDKTILFAPNALLFYANCVCNHYALFNSINNQNNHPIRTKTTIPSEQKHELRKEKTSVFEKYLLKNSLKKAHSRSTADGVTTVLCGLASIIFFSMAANATGLLSGIISALLFGTISLVFAILCFIFMIRWAINLCKKEAK